MKTQLMILISSFFLLVALSNCRKSKNSNYTLEFERLKMAFYETELILKDSLDKELTTYMSRHSLFLDVPITPNLENCRKQWKNVADAYCTIRPFTAGNSVLDNGMDKSSYYYYPINYGYVDYTSTNSSSGIINDGTYTNYTNPLVYHQVGSQDNCACNFQVLEFLLWGEDLSLTGTGTRTYTDYLGTGNNNAIRSKFLYYSSYQTNYSLFNNNLDANYKKSVMNLTKEQTITLLFSSMKSFIDNELILKDLQTPINSQNSHLEMFDYSDYTLEGIKAKLKGLSYYFDPRELLDGYYTDYFFIDFIEQIDEEAATSIKNSLANSFSKLNSITDTFENAITNPISKNALEGLIKELKNISNQLATVEAKI